jgi:hypothetical protein
MANSKCAYLMMGESPKHVVNNKGTLYPYRSCADGNKYNCKYDKWSLNFQFAMTHSGHEIFSFSITSEAVACRSLLCYLTFLCLRTVKSIISLKVRCHRAQLNKYYIFSKWYGHLYLHRCRPATNMNRGKIVVGC